VARGDPGGCARDPVARGSGGGDTARSLMLDTVIRRKRMACHGPHCLSGRAHVRTARLSELPVAVTGAVAPFSASLPWPGAGRTRKSVPSLFHAKERPQVCGERWGVSRPVQVSDESSGEGRCAPRSAVDGGACRGWSMSATEKRRRGRVRPQVCGGRWGVSRLVQVGDGKAAAKTRVGIRLAHEHDTQRLSTMADRPILTTNGQPFITTRP
jgi:hypothetical protein